jgi:hypothetical protein
MTQSAKALPATGMNESPADLDEQHPLAKALHKILASPDDATIGELARLLESISGEMSFYASAMAAPAVPDESGAQGAVVAHGDLATTSGELDALGTLLKALALAEDRLRAGSV